MWALKSDIGSFQMMISSATTGKCLKAKWTLIGADEAPYDVSFTMCPTLVCPHGSPSPKALSALRAALSHLRIIKKAGFVDVSAPTGSALATPTGGATEGGGTEAEK